MISEEDSAKAERILDAVLRDILDRRGFRQTWDSVGKDVRAEMRATLLKIVEEELTTA